MWDAQVYAGSDIADVAAEAKHVIDAPSHSIVQ